MSTLYKLETLREIAETTFWTGQVDGEIPVSLMLVGPSGAAKSKLLKSYQEPQIHVSDNVSSMDLWDIAANDAKGEIRFILIPDINPTLSRKSSTTQATVSNLLSLTADGTVRVDDGRREKKCEHAPIGLVTSCTPEIYEKHARQWFALGLRRRIIPVFYGYTSATKMELQTLTRNGKIHSTQPVRIPLKFRAKRGRPAIANPEAEEIEKLSLMLAQNLGKLAFFDGGSRRWQTKEVIPISPHVTLRTLAMAHALRRGAGQVSKTEDVAFLVLFLDFTDPEKPRAI